MRIQRQLLFVIPMLWSAFGSWIFIDAQELSPIEMIKLYPPDKGIFKEHGVQLAEQMLQWQIKRGEVHRRLLADEIAKIRSQIEDIERAAENEADEQPQEYRYATDTVREELIGQCLQKLLDIRVDIAANEVLLDELEKTLKDGEARKAEEDAEARSIQSQKQLLMEQIKILEQRADRIEQLQKRGAVAEVQETQLRLLTLRGELAKLEQVNQIQRNRDATQLASRIKDLRLETRRMSAFEKAALRQLEQLAKAAKAARGLKQRQREQSQLEQRLALRVERHEQVLAELEEANVLLKQIQDHKVAPKIKPPDNPRP